MLDNMRNKIERFVEIIGRRWKPRRNQRIADCQVVAGCGNRQMGNGKDLKILLLLNVSRQSDSRRNKEIGCMFVFWKRTKWTTPL